ncbi:MAG: Si-specific NAD(P)(+) transhydrogenase [Acidobacteriaceae bacterium]|nr:Si-specific NAD(P)(+) transhydrogenase [Acidobacteriaceae bacterium]
MMMQNKYDLAVIGAGPAGIVGATTAASLGARVVLVDRFGDLGGAGANTGTVPSKTLRETALTLSGTRSRDLYGVDLSLRRETTVADLMRREHAVKEALNRMLAQLVEASSVEFIVGDAHFEDAHNISVRSDTTSRLVHAEKILISTGSSPHRPAGFPFDKPGVYDSDTILELETIPKSLAVVGAGAVGSEYACTFAALGTKVHLIDSRDVLLPFLDSEVSDSLARAIRASGIEMHGGERVAECTGAGDEITLRLESGCIVQTQAVLVAAGRRSNTTSLNLAAAGVTAEERGDLKVDEHYRTAVPNIYAAGDVIGFPALASTGMQQARRAMTLAFGTADDVPVRDILPSAVYTIPEVAMAGDTEQAVHAAGIDYIVGRAQYTNNPRGCIIGEKEGFLKLIFRREDLKLLGVHAIGEHASELVHIGLIAMTADCDATVFSKLCFNVPTLGALYQDATWRLINERAQMFSAVSKWTLT